MPFVSSPYTFVLRSLRVGGSMLVGAALLLLLIGAAHAQSTPVLQADNADGDSTMISFDDGGFGVFGRSSISASNSIFAEGPGIRMMWYPKKRAFRVGQVDGTQWDDSNTGSYSVAMGRNTTASGFGAIALGNGGTANAEGAVVIGGDINRGNSQPSQATGSRSLVLGNSATATGRRAVAIGSQSSTGTPVSASGEGAMVLGPSTATALYSTAIGLDARADGTFSTAVGYKTTAATDESITVGTFNSANTSDDNSLFVVGNGDVLRGTRSDALVLDRSGNLSIAGSLTESSDRRLKTDIRPLEAGTLDELSQIQAVRFHFKEGTGHPVNEQIGLVAQEVAHRFPELVQENNNGYLSVSYSKLTAVLLKGMQEQQALIVSQRRAHEDLEARMTALEASVSNNDSAKAGLGQAGLLGFLIGTALIGGLLVWRRRRA